MNFKKSSLLIISLLCVGLICFLLYFFLFKKQEIPKNTATTDTECLLFQNTDPEKPCFIAIKPIETPTTTPTTINTVISSCVSNNKDETDVCVKNLAITSKDSSLCSAISGILEKSDCINSVGRVDKPLQQVFANPIVNTEALSITATNPIKTSVPTSSTLGDVLEKMRQTVEDTKANPDPRLTADGLYERMAEYNKTHISLYAFSEYQVAPGTVITAQGAGFTKTGNTLYIGSYSISGLESADGSTLSFTVPSLNKGTYEGWVENSNGSSKKDGIKIMLMITNSPTPKPVIASISPKNPLSTDTITFLGENFSSSVSVATTFGNKESMPASGGSFSLKPSDLPFYEKVKTAPGVTGNPVSFFIYVYNENGVSGKPFVFDIQF